MLYHIYLYGKIDVKLGVKIAVKSLLSWELYLFILFFYQDFIKISYKHFKQLLHS